MKKIRQILLVEDDETNILLCQNANIKFSLTKNLVVRRNGKEALINIEELSKEGQYFLPCLIIFDIEMLVMDANESNNSSFYFS